MKIKSCPFCGSDEIEVLEYSPYDGYQREPSSYIVRCQYCKTAVERSTKEEAISFWNRRGKNGMGI